MHESEVMAAKLVYYV